MVQDFNVVRATPEQQKNFEGLIKAETDWSKAYDKAHGVKWNDGTTDDGLRDYINTYDGPYIEEKEAAHKKWHQSKEYKAVAEKFYGKSKTGPVPTSRGHDSRNPSMRVGQAAASFTEAEYQAFEVAAKDESNSENVTAAQKILREHDVNIGKFGNDGVDGKAGKGSMTDKALQSALKTHANTMRTASKTSPGGM